MPFKNLIYETVKRDAGRFSLNENDSYLEAYPEFIDYFKKIDMIEKHHLIISSHFVYGWMPTVLHLDTTDINQVLSLLNAAKCGHILLAAELKKAMKCINNSMVGLSKLLHFINPKDYAIWDSRILKYISGNKTTYGINNPDLYLDYLQGLHEIAINTNYPSLHALIAGNFKYPLEPMRVIELVMFETERKKVHSM